MQITRGDLVIATFPGDYGKPRPALVVQADGFARLPSLTVLPLTSDLQPAPLTRIAIAPSQSNGLERRSHIMIDKTATILRSRIGQRIGHVGAETMSEVGAALVRFFDIG